MSQPKWGKVSAPPLICGVVCVAACLLVANFGEVAAAEDATSASRPDTNWSQEVWSEALAGNADHCLELLQQVPADLTVSNPSLAVALQQYNQNLSLAEAEVLGQPPTRRRGLLEAEDVVPPEDDARVVA